MRIQNGQGTITSESDFRDQWQKEVQIPSSRTAAHNASTAATREVGTVNNPRRVYSPTLADTSYRRKTLRHNKFDSDPTYVRFGPMFTPISTASTAAGPIGATSGAITSVAARCLQTVASTGAR